MTDRDLNRRNSNQAAPTQTNGAPAYSRPRLAYVGSVVQTVQSGPTGNRYETYQGSYWSGR
jgi:hypothetical protein